MTEQMQALSQRLKAYAQEEPRTLAELEQVVLQGVKEVGNALLAGLCQLMTPRYPAAQVACDCGESAVYQRQRSGQTKTLLGTITLPRAYYLCPHCHRGHCPLDEQLGFCAGGMSAGLDELLALMGAQCPFAEAAQLVGKLTLVAVCANGCRAATEQLGQLIDEAEAAEMARVWAGEQPRAAPAVAVPMRLYSSMDGTSVHIEEEGFCEIRLGAVYTTQPTRSPTHPQRLQIRAQASSFYVDFDEVETFGNQLWLEATRRGVSEAQEVIVIGDGAHWIWRIAEEHFAQATQILDWYHVTEYVWKCAAALYGEGNDLAKAWAKDRLDELWAGQVQTVLAQLTPLATKHKVIAETITYFTNNQQRMRYLDYRTRGLQIGSGTIESACKHLIAQRLDQAGMLWSLDGARAVAKVRARLKSGRWAETIALRSPPSRSYNRLAA
jgi:hypothetical protein